MAGCDPLVDDSRLPLLLFVIEAKRVDHHRAPEMGSGPFLGSCYQGLIRADARTIPRLQFSFLRSSLFGSTVTGEESRLLGVGSDPDRDGGFCLAVVEDGEDLESGAEAVEVAAQGRDLDVLAAFEL